MDQIEVWGAGRPLPGFSDDDVVTNAQKLFPASSPAQIARFIAGDRFVIARVTDAEVAKKLIDALAESGIPAETASAPALMLVDDVPPSTKASPSPPPSPQASPRAATSEGLSLPPRRGVDSHARLPANRGNRKVALAAAGGLIAAAVAGVAVQRHLAHERALAAKAEAMAKVQAEEAKQRAVAEADARKWAADAEAQKAQAAANAALSLQKKEAAAAEVSQAFAAGNYPETIARSERFDVMYGPDTRVQKLEYDATYNLKEAARHGDFAAILDAPVNGSARFAQLREWALKVQEHAKPLIVEGPGSVRP